MMKIIRTLFRWLVGATFIFSGFVKVIDPLGYGYKIEEYLEAMHLDAIANIALPLAIILAVLELVIGFSLFFRQLPKLGALGALLMLCIFTPLTLWLAIANPVTDCGCFGDALVISNWQTFFKNLVLLGMSILLFIQRKKITTLYHSGIQWGIMVVVGLSTLGLGIYCLKTLPIIDFRPYHIGANIAEEMIIPEDAPKDVYENRWIYERKSDGERVVFNEYDAPQGNPDWTFIETDHKLISKGYEPRIKNFEITPLSSETPKEVDLDMVELRYKREDGQQMLVDVGSIPGDTSYKYDGYQCDDCEDEIDVSKIRITYRDANGNEHVMGVDDMPVDMEYVSAIYEDGNLDGGALSKDALSLIERCPTIGNLTAKVLTDDNYTFLMIALEVEDMDTEHLNEFDSIAAFAAENNMGFYCMTASASAEVEKFVDEHKPMYEIYNSDHTELKTIVRTNPGLLLIRKGTVINKWHGGNLPEVEDLRNELTGEMLSEQHNQRDRLLYIVWILSALLAMAFIRIVFDWLVKNRYINDKRNLI